MPKATAIFSRVGEMLDLKAPPTMNILASAPPGLCLYDFMSNVEASTYLTLLDYTVTTARPTMFVHGVSYQGQFAIRHITIHKRKTDQATVIVRPYPNCLSDPKCKNFCTKH
jgi:hypothetical protein